MITVTCDKCGEILNINNRVDLELNYEGLSTFGGYPFKPQHKQLCVTCAIRLLEWIDDRVEEGGDIDV